MTHSTNSAARFASLPPLVPFTCKQLCDANNAWGANCGPGSLAAVLEMALDEIRPKLDGFERRGYMGPTHMYAALRACDAKFFCDLHPRSWPEFGLARIQWEGPWMEPGVPIAARYAHTHWVGAHSMDEETYIFDVNAMFVAGELAGWVPVGTWVRYVVPFILERSQPRANGRWHITHAIEVQRA